MAENIGQVTEEVDALAAEFEARAGDLETVKSVISAKLAATTWTGSDRQRFEAEWEGAMSQSLTQITLAVRSAGQQAADQAQEQRDASA